MSHGDDAIEGIGGRADAEGLSPGMQAWQRYLDMQDQMDADAAAEAQAAEHLEEEARQGRIVRAGPTSLDVAGAAALAKGLGTQAIDQVEHGDRVGALAAMQAEALARLELAPHVDAVNAAQRAADGLDVDAQIERRVEHDEKHFDGQLQNREQQRAPDAIASPDDLVKGVQGEEDRTAAERGEDRAHYQERLRRDER